MPKVTDPRRVAGSRYPPPFDEPCRERTSERLADTVGITQFGVNRLTLPPGAWSAQRHWHSHEDEFFYVLRGEVVLVDDSGEHVLTEGDGAGYPAGPRDARYVRNDADVPAEVLVIGSRIEADSGEYPDIDLAFGAGRYGAGAVFRRKDGSAY